MAGLATGLGESRIARFAIGALSLVLVTLVAQPDIRTSHKTPGTTEQVRAFLTATVWREAARVQHCPRAALREPAGGDATALLRSIVSDTLRGDDSPFAACEEQLMRLHAELQPPCERRPCRLVPLLSLAPHPEVAEACAPLHHMIDRVARATAACSPVPAEEVERFTSFLTWIPRAVHLHVAPLVQRGDLADAARHVTNAMRVADDLGRSGSLIGAMIGVAFTGKLAETLNEILVDPRLTAAEARAISTDLDQLRKTAPSFTSIMRQENAWLAIELERTDDPQGMSLEILERDQLMRVIEASCEGTTDACTTELKRVSGGELWAYYAERLRYRDSALRSLRMLAEQRSSD